MFFHDKNFIKNHGFQSRVNQTILILEAISLIIDLSIFCALCLLNLREYNYIFTYTLFSTQVSLITITILYLCMANIMDNLNKITNKNKL